MAAPSPECFLGLPPDQRDEAIIIIVIEGVGGGNLNLYEQPDGEFFYNQLDGSSFYLIPA